MNTIVNISKGCANFTAILVALPFLATLAAFSFIGARRAFAGHGEFLSLFPGVPGVFVRRAFFRLTLSRCSDTVSIGFGTLLSNRRSAFGNHVYVGPYCSIGEVNIGNDVLIGSHVSIPNGARQHGIERLDIPVREQPGEWPRIDIGDDTWIGDRAVVMAHVGSHCIIGAGAVVTKPVADYEIVAGCPAHVIGRRDSLSVNTAETDKSCAE